MPDRTDVQSLLNRAVEIVETGDQRLLASDGEAGGQPPELSLEEWRELYLCIVAAADLMVPGDQAVARIQVQGGMITDVSKLGPAKREPPDGEYLIFPAGERAS